MSFLLINWTHDFCFWFLCVATVFYFLVWWWLILFFFQSCNVCLFQPKINWKLKLIWTLFVLIHITLFFFVLSVVKVPQNWRNWSSDAVKFGGRMGWLGGRICTLFFWFLVRKNLVAELSWQQITETYFWAKFVTILRGLLLL